MLKYQHLTITHPEEELIILLQKMKESDLAIFQYQKKLASDYAKNIFAPEDHVGCFKTRRATLAEASVWIVIIGEELKVTNITPNTVSSLGITQYNMILNAFFNDFVAKFLDESWAKCISISGEVISLSDILSEEVYNALEIWEATCNKTSPLAHPDDLECWMKFITLLHKSKIELSVEDFSQWLSEDKKWPQGFSTQISELEESLKYSLELLNYYDGTNI